MRKFDNYGTPHNGVWRKMVNLKRLCLIMTMFLVVQVSASTYSQNVKLDVSIKNASIETLMRSIRSQSDFSFFYDDRAVENINNITVKASQASVEDIMKMALKNSAFSFKIVDNTIILFRATAADQKKVVIKGRVIDPKGVPMFGVAVSVEGTTLGTSTNDKGEFTLSLSSAKGVLSFSFIGYKTKKVTLVNDTPLVVKMAEDQARIDEVTVVAYGQRNKRELTSAISSVKAEDLKELPTHSLENLLQGRMAGVEINNISGSPGGGGSVVAIRGYNSLFVEGEGLSRQYAEPLYVVDGVPIHSFSSPVTGANTLSDLDPSMIESVEVLKDAASAAIYGSRAGNGVILITTKKGREGNAKFTANVSYSASWLPKTVEQTGGRMERMYHLAALQNTVLPYKDQLTGNYVYPTSYKESYSPSGSGGTAGLKGQYDMFWNGGNGMPVSPILQDSLNPFYNNSTNWFRYSFQMANVVNANLQMSGGNEMTQYIIGLGYYNETGIMINSGFSRMNVMSNITVRPIKNLRVDSRTTIALSDRSRGGNLSGGTAKIEGMSVDPIYESTLRPGSGEVENNVLRGLQSMVEKNQSYTLRTSINLNYEIIKNLNFSTSASVDYNQQNQNHFEPSDVRPEKRSLSQGTISRSVMLLNENLLNYSFSINNKHNFDFLAGLSFQKDQSFSNGGYAEGGPNNKIQYVGDGWGGSEGLINVGSGGVKAAHKYTSDFEEERMESVFGRVSYNYDKKYLFDATIRRDGSSVFGENVRWATFPSFSAGWAFTQEKFMKRLYWLSFGKIRGSWGTSGQKFGQRYLAHGLFTPSSESFLGMSGMAPSGGMINRNLTWEETSQYDIGLDMDMFDYRFKVKVDYYYRYTKGQLHNVELPGNVYFHNSQWQNAMETSNQGIELETEVEIFRETAVKWRVRLNGARNWNRLEKSYSGFDIGEYIIGKPLYQIRLYQDDGFYNSVDEIPMYYSPQGEQYPLHEGINATAETVFIPGSRRIKDLNGDGAINDKDMYYVASPLPLINGGIGSELRWKGFDLNLLFTYSMGRHIYKVYDDFKLVPSDRSAPMLFDINKLSCWPNADAKYPKSQAYKLATPYKGDYASSVENVNFIRLKQITLGYNLPETWVKRMGINGIRAFLTVENLFVLSNYSGLDPEIVSIYDGVDNLRQYPLSRKFTCGLTVNF